MMFRGGLSVFLCCSAFLATCAAGEMRRFADKPDPFASPYAVKGGTIRFDGHNPPKSYNAYVDNDNYTRMLFELMYETLVTTDPDTLEFMPGLACGWSVSDDGRDIEFEIDPQARWSDGEPVTAEDVKWTFDTVLDPASDAGSYQVILESFDSPEVVDAKASGIHRRIRFHSKREEKDWRTFLNCATFEIMPSHAFKGKKFAALNLENAVVSGPYVLAEVDDQVQAVFERRRDWWRIDRASSKGLYNFDRIVVRYFADNENSFEALKKGIIDLYPVYSAHLMATQTKGERFDKNWILKRRIYNRHPIGFQGFGMNMRRFPFDDLRVRKAMSYLLDRETMNRTIMYNEYFLHNSYFQSLYDGVEACPNQMYGYDVEKAKALLAEAGWRRNPETGILEKGGKPFVFTYLSRGSDEKFLSLYTAALKSVGIEMKIDREDFASWMRDMDSFNFDMTWASFGAVVFRAPEVLWSSSEADHEGGNNLTGLKSAKIDALIAKERGMNTQAERDDCYRAIDAIIAGEVPYVLLWNTDSTRLLYWNKFGMPAKPLAKYGREEAVLVYWWYDADAAGELSRAMKNGTYLPSVPEIVK